jgi:hypothetical protein
LNSIAPDVKSTLISGLTFDAHGTRACNRQAAPCILANAVIVNRVVQT